MIVPASSSTADLSGATVYPCRLWRRISHRGRVRPPDQNTILRRKRARRRTEPDSTRGQSPPCRVRTGPGRPHPIAPAPLRRRGSGRPPNLPHFRETPQHMGAVSVPPMLKPSRSTASTTAEPAPPVKKKKERERCQNVPHSPAAVVPGRPKLMGRPDANSRRPVRRRLSRETWVSLALPVAGDRWGGSWGYHTLAHRLRLRPPHSPNCPAAAFDLKGRFLPRPAPPFRTRRRLNGAEQFEGAGGPRTALIVPPPSRSFSPDGPSRGGNV